jgi:acylphosphatase
VIARRLVVRGRVQGVGFRHATAAAAAACGVAGWVRNCRDGSVEALVQGEPAQVERAIDWCRRGPPAARVEAVDVHDAPVDPARTGFDRLPTA